MGQLTVIEATEGATLNSLFAAGTVTGKGKTALLYFYLPVQEIIKAK